jgi:hypothetical protein
MVPVVEQICGHFISHKPSRIGAVLALARHFRGPPYRRQSSSSHLDAVTRVALGHHIEVADPRGTISVSDHSVGIIPKSHVSFCRSAD